MQKNTVAGNSLNAVEHEAVPTRVLNPKAWEVQGRSPGGHAGGKPHATKKMDFDLAC